MRKLPVLLVVLLSFLPIAASQDYVKIDTFYYTKELTVEQGDTTRGFAILQNMHNDTLYSVFLNFQLSNKFEVKQQIDGIEEILSNQKKPIHFDIKAVGATPGIYNASLWATSASQIGSNYIRSLSVNFTLRVLQNSTPIIETTTPSINASTTSLPPRTTTTATPIIKPLIRPKGPQLILVVIGIIILLALILFFMTRS